MENKEQIKTEEEDELGEIKLSDYQKLGEDFREWLNNVEELPEDFWEKIRNTEQGMDLRGLFNKLRKELFIVYGNERGHAKSFADSRFTSLSEMIKRRMTSCGAMTNIFGTALRNFGIPVKFIHGKLESQEGERMRHSWLELYDPKKDEWFEADPAHKNFTVFPDAKRYKTYHNWLELKEDYDRGEF
jgi:hypothetical protein